MIEELTVEFLCEPGLTLSRSLSSITPDRRDPFTPYKPGVAATAEGQTGKEGYAYAGQSGPEPTLRFPVGFGRRVKTGCSDLTGTRQVPPPSIFGRLVQLDRTLGQCKTAGHRCLAASRPEGSQAGVGDGGWNATASHPPEDWGFESFTGHQIIRADLCICRLEPQAERVLGATLQPVKRRYVPIRKTSSRLFTRAVKLSPFPPGELSY